MATQLEHETARYLDGLSQWSRENRGQYVVICGDFLHFYPSLNEALTDGYDRFDRRPFFVKQVVARDHVERVTPQRVVPQPG